MREDRRPNGGEERDPDTTEERPIAGGAGGSPPSEFRTDEFDDAPPSGTFRFPRV